MATLDPSTFQRLQEEDNRLQEFPLDIKDFDDVYRLSEALLDVDSGRHTRLDGAEMRLTETLRFIVVIRVSQRPTGNDADNVGTDKGSRRRV